MGKKGKSDAQVYLEQVRFLELKIKNKLVERKLWRDTALGITANMDGEKVKTSGSSSKMANAVEKLVDAESEIDSLVDQFIDVKKEVLQTIESLDNPMEYEVLHLRFIQFKDLQEIADQYNKGYDWVTTTQGRGFSNVQKILNERSKGVT